MCGFDFSYSDEILQFVDHHIAAYIWWLCPQSWWVHPAYLLAGPAFIFLKFSPDLFPKPCRKYSYLYPFFMNQFLKLHCLKFSYSVCECHKRLLSSCPTHIRFGFFQSILTFSWAIIIIQTKCCRGIRSYCRPGSFLDWFCWVIEDLHPAFPQTFECSCHGNLEESFQQ